MNMPTMPGSNKQEVNVTNSLPGEIPIVNDKPEYITPDTNNNSVVNVPKFPTKGIEVVAMRKGFYNQKRISEGEKFICKKKEDLGTWMKCLDFDLERERLKFFKDKKAKK